MMWEWVLEVDVGRRRQGKREVPLEPGQPRLVDRVAADTVCAGCQGLVLPTHQPWLSLSPVLARWAHRRSHSQLSHGLDPGVWLKLRVCSARGLPRGSWEPPFCPAGAPFASGGAESILQRRLGATRTSQSST